MKNNKSIINSNGDYAVKVGKDQAITSSGKSVRKIGGKTWIDEDGNPFFEND